jgi:hypothetical protein
VDKPFDLFGANKQLKRTEAFNNILYESEEKGNASSVKSINVIKLMRMEAETIK